jgi:glycosyltransferase 2 family protein
MPEEPSRLSRPWWRRPLVWIGFALSALAIATFIWRFDLRQLGASLRQLRWWAPLGAAGFFVCSLVVRGLRWRALITPLARPPAGQVRDVLIIGFMVNLLLPARAGELTRALLLARLAGVSRRASLATIGIERLLDGFTLLGGLALLGLLFPVPSWTRHLGWVMLAVVSALAALLLWLALHDASLFAVLDRLLFFIPSSARRRVIDFLRRFVDGTAAVRSPALLAQAAGLSLLIWSLEIGIYLTMLRGFPTGLPAWAAAMALIVTNFGIAVPSAPGYVGVFEAACGGALMALGLQQEMALSYALSLHGMFYCCLIGLGLPLLWRLGLRLGDVARAAEAEVERPEAPSR